MGYVSNDEASSIKCTCPVEFDRIVYDIPTDQWVLDLDYNTGVAVEEIRVPNECNLDDITQCADASVTPTISISKRTEHNWGNIFKAGVSYTAEASATFEGFGAKESITISAEASRSTGGSYAEDVTYTATTSCTAPPNSVTTCRYMVYKGTIEVGYTVYWRNASPTYGAYKGQGWRIEMSPITDPL